MAQLTVERLFANPPLTGTLPTQLKWAPDGSYVAYLKPAEDDRERLDLWRLDMNTREHRLWIDASDLIDRDAILSDAEKAERERRRLFSTGITSYEISPDGRHLLIPAGGTGHLYHIESGELIAFTPTGTRQTDFTFSPLGHYISFVRGGNLYCYDIEQNTEKALTSDGGGAIANGIADFIAQEEMHRFEGHWWSPDEFRIAFTRTDESSIAVSQRYEIDADTINVIEQHYPYAGAANADVGLRVYNLANGTTVSVDYQHAPDDYLARVTWGKDRLFAQTQSRDQKRLFLDAHRPGTPGRTTLLEERSDTWLNLHDNFRPLDGDRFLWTSERDGNAQLFLYSNGEATRLSHPSTPDSGQGSSRVESILHVDEEQVIYTGWDDSPTEQHAFRLCLSSGEETRLSRTPGWHEFAADASGSRFIDRYTSLTDAGSIDIIRPGDVEPIPFLAEGGSHPYDDYLRDHVTPVLGTLTASDGQTLQYRLTRPENSNGLHPLIVYVYGGPGVNRVRNEWAPLLLQLFASRGFGVLELDNRGSSGRGSRFEAPIYRHMGQAEVEDQLLGARFAQTLDWVDEDRIGVFGHSYGGYMTLMCLAKAARVFKAGVAVAPVTAWELYDTHYTERYLGTPSENPEGYAQSAVFPHLDGLEGKLLLIHGMADDNVLFTHSTRLIKALQSRCYPFEMMAYPGSKHALQEESVSIHRFNLILDFFERALAGK